MLIALGNSATIPTSRGIILSPAQQPLPGARLGQAIPHDYDDHLPHGGGFPYLVSAYSKTDPGTSVLVVYLYYKSLGVRS